MSTTTTEAPEVLEIPADYGEVILVRVLRREDGSVIRDANTMPQMIQIATCDPGQSFEEAYNSLDLPLCALGHIGSWLRAWMDQDLQAMKESDSPEPPRVA